MVSDCGCLDLIFVQRAELYFFLCWWFMLYNYFIIKGSMNQKFGPQSCFDRVSNTLRSFHRHSFSDDLIHVSDPVLRRNESWEVGE